MLYGKLKIPDIPKNKKKSSFFLLSLLPLFIHMMILGLCLSQMALGLVETVGGK
jgi:hypothetical protein